MLALPPQAKLEPGRSDQIPLLMAQATLEGEPQLLYVLIV